MLVDGPAGRRRRADGALDRRRRRAGEHAEQRELERHEERQPPEDRVGIPQDVAVRVDRVDRTAEERAGHGAEQQTRGRRQRVAHRRRASLSGAGCPAATAPTRHRRSLSRRVVENAILGFVVALGISLALTPVGRLIAYRVGAIDTPRGDRHLHSAPTAKLGGLAIAVGVAVATLLFLPENDETRGILIGGALMVAIGALDDLKELPAWAKLLGQVAAAIVPVVSGVRVQSATVPFVGVVDLTGPLSYVLPVIGIVAIANIVNFIDGVDGLAAGVCTIAAVTFAVITLSLDRSAAGILALATAGAALGYLAYGFQPATIFLGDSGSNLLGYLLAVVSIQGALKTNAVIALVFPLVILAVPILDSSFVIAKRLKYGKRIYSGDRWHFHHRFANIGFSPRRTVLYLYGWTLSLGALALALRFVPYSDNSGNLDLEWSLVIAAFFLVAAAASVYLIVVLEIFKLTRFRRSQLRELHSERGEPPPDDPEVKATVAHELETGEYRVVDPTREP